MSAETLRGKTVLINGGTGSFGNTVVSSFLDRGVEEIRVLSRDEKKQDDMRRHYGSDRIRFYIGDVRDIDSIRVASKGCNYVFHAAALKQVPSCEFFPMEAVRTNVVGTDNAIRAAIENDVQRVVVLSTDKAVYPINAMGISKAMMEKVAVARSRHIGSDGPTINVTRYGNVMASRGSVIPLFVSQILKGDPLTVTHPEMTRFMMSLPQSVDLVEFAYKHGRQGDTFIQKSPACTIRTLCEALMKILDRVVDIKVIGIRHGEKMYELLASGEEMLVARDLGNYYSIPCDARDLNYEQYVESGEPVGAMPEPYGSHNTQVLDVDGMVELLSGIDYIRTVLGQEISSKSWMAA